MTALECFAVLWAALVIASWLYLAYLTDAQILRLGRWIGRKGRKP
jgi:hypothetical protein